MSVSKTLRNAKPANLIPGTNRVLGVGFHDINHSKEPSQNTQAMQFDDAVRMYIKAHRK